MIYPEHDLTGATFTPPAGHYWHGWRFDILGPARPGARMLGDQELPDLWLQQATRLHDGAVRQSGVVSGIGARDWFGLAHPAYTPDHAEMLAIDHYWPAETRERWAVSYRAGTAYAKIIEEVRREAVQGCQGFHGGSLSYQTQHGQILVRRPVTLALDLIKAARRAFPEPGTPRQLSLF